MKKTYIQPAMDIVMTDLQPMLTASDGTVVIDPSDSGDPSDADSRLLEDMLGLPQPFKMPE